MRIRFWGTRGSIASPGPATLRYGGNTSCVEVRSGDGTLIVLDCGTGAHALGRALAAEEKGPDRGHLLITHTHWDHIQGFPFFAPLRVASGEWDVFGPRGVGSSLRETLAGQMNYTYFPVDLSGLDARVRYQELIEGSFELGDVRIQARYLNHPAVTLGYRLEADGVVVVYATDHEPHSRQLALGEEPTSFTLEDDAHAEFLEGADLVIHDTQYTASEYTEHVGWGHSTVEYVAGRVRDRDVQRLALFHHDPTRDDDAIDWLVDAAAERLADAAERTQVVGAAEGLTLDIEPRSPRRRSAGPAGSAQRLPGPGAREPGVVLCARSQEAIQVFRDATAADHLSLRVSDDIDEVLRIVGSSAPSIVVLEHDVVGAGLERTVRTLRGAAEGPVVIGLAGGTDDPATAARGNGGVDGWIVMPVTVQYARSRLRSWMLRTACRWRPAPAPPDEENRLAALRELGVLDTPAEERFDRYTRIAAALFRVPTALVSLVDGDRQWFKSKHGIDTTQTPRDQAFCAHAILGTEVFQVVDARLHPDFADSPLVTGPPHLRFYAGAPLIVGDGAHVGTLCLLDYYPRELDAGELALLGDLARLVERELESRPADG